MEDVNVYGPEESSETNPSEASETPQIESEVGGSKSA